MAAIEKAYLKSLGDCPRYTQAEERLLAKWMRAGIQEARDNLIRSQLPWAAKCAQRLGPYLGLPIDDAIGEANLGVIEAVDSFDPRKGRLTTWAQVHIRKRLVAAYLDRDLIRVPRHALRSAGPSVCQEDVETRLDWEPGPAADPADVAELNERLDFLEAALRLCPPRERYVFRRRFHQGAILAEIAKDLGISKERVRQLENRAIRRIDEVLQLGLPWPVLRRLRETLGLSRR